MNTLQCADLFNQYPPQFRIAGNPQLQKVTILSGNLMNILDAGYGHQGGSEIRVAGMLHVT